MRDALVFNPSSQLEFQEVRMNVVRIPEVIARVRRAQIAWDFVNVEAFDLFNFILSDDLTFAADPARRRVALAVVQLGLFDRLLAKQSQSVIVAGREDGPVAVAARVKTLTEFLAESSEYRAKSLALAWYLRDDAGVFTRIDPLAMRFERLVVIGPGRLAGDADARGIDSLDLDPALAWFWRSLAEPDFRVAN